MQTSAGYNVRSGETDRRRERTEEGERRRERLEEGAVWNQLDDIVVCMLMQTFN